MQLYPNSPYDEIISKLVERGIPRDQIAAMGDADSDAKKQVLFKKVRNGVVRVLLGSTQKMGTGTNVQKRLVALHHLDAPWKPAEVEQRDGRILRQGNENAEVAIYRYVTEGSFDAYMWQALETKARFIGQVITGANASRRAEDIGGQELSYAEVKAIASGNPAVLTLAQADAELQRLAILKKNHMDEQYVARRQIRDLPATIRNLRERHEKLTADRQTADDCQHLPVFIGRNAVLRADVPVVLEKKLDTMPIKIVDTMRFPIGTYRGLEFGMILYPRGQPDVYLEGAMTRITGVSSVNPGPRAVLNAIERLLGSFDVEITHIEQDMSIAESQLHDYEARLGKSFAHEAYVSKLTQLRNALKERLTGRTDPTTPTEGPTIAELVTSIKSLTASHTVDTSQPRNERRHTTAEEPVTARIRRKQEAGAISSDDEFPAEHQQAVHRPVDIPEPDDTSFSDRVRLSQQAANRELSPA